MSDLDRLDALVRAYDAEAHRVRAAVEAFARATWAGMPDYRDDAIGKMAAAIAPRVRAGQLRTADLTRAYLAQCARELGMEPDTALVDADAVTGLRGVDPAEVYTRPGRTVWTALSQGKPLDAAVKEGELRLIQLIGGDLQNAKRVQSRTSMRASGIQAYRRVLTGRENCALCVIASTQRYWVEGLLPIHPGCDCATAPLPPGMGVDQVIDEETLEAAHKAVEDRTGASDRGGRDPDYHRLIVTTEHGEYGPVISFRPKAGSAGRPRGRPRGRPGRATGGEPADRITVPEGLIIAPHEMRTARALAESGLDVSFRPLTHEHGVKNPDARIDGEDWEFKAPTGSSPRNTIADQFKRARKQARRLVLDLRRSGLPDDVALPQIEARFKGQERIIDLIVIDHRGVMTRHTKPGTLDGKAAAGPH